MSGTSLCNRATTVIKSISANTRKPDLTFYKSGRIDISAAVTKALALHKGDVIDIASDGIEYYIYAKYRAATVVGRHRGRCFPSKQGKRKSNNMRAHSVALTSVVLRIHHADVVSLPVGCPVNVPQLGGIALPIIIRNRL